MSNVIEDFWVSDTALLVYRRVVMATLWPIIVALGIFSNAFNILVFVRIKPLDSVTISFLALSLTDLSHLCLITIHVTGGIFSLAYPRNHVGPADPFTLYTVFFWYAYIFYDSSALITAFIAVARCCIVAIPFHFKNLFTRSRTVVILCSLVAVSVLLRLPMLLIHRLVVLNDTETNMLLLKHEVTGDLYNTYTINDIVNGNIVPWATFIIILGCLAILVIKLRAAKRFRQLTVVSANSNIGIKKSTEISKQVSNTSAKDLQIIKSVALVSGMFIVLSTPLLAYSTARRIEPEFTTRGPYNNLFVVMTILSRTCGYLNASMNTAVYYHCNTKFKKVCLSLIPRQKCE